MNGYWLRYIDLSSYEWIKRVKNPVLRGTPNYA
mgnify:CR=1 FL=1